MTNNDDAEELMILIAAKYFAQNWVRIPTELYEQQRTTEANK